MGKRDGFESDRTHVFFVFSYKIALYYFFYHLSLLGRKVVNLDLPNSVFFRRKPSRFRGMAEFRA